MPAPFVIAVAIVLALCSVGCSEGDGGGRDDVVVRVDRVHDLVALLPDAEISDGSPYLRGLDDRPAAAIEDDDPRDALAYLRVPSGTDLTWRGLRVGAGARFDAAVGVGWSGQGVGGRVRMTVDVRDEALGDDAWRTLVDEVVEVAELSAPRLARSVGAAWPEGEGPWSLRLATVSDDGAEHHWPAFLSPRITSDGFGEAVGDLPIVVRDAHADLLGRLASAAEVEAPDSSPVEEVVLDPAVNVIKAGGKRAALRVAPGARVVFDHEVEAGEVLSFAVGVDEVEGWRRHPRGVRFVVAVDGERVWERELEPARRRRHRGWHSARVDLAPWDGSIVSLELSTEALPGDGAAPTAAGFAGPVVERDTVVPRALSDERPFVLVVLVDTLRADRAEVGEDGALLMPRVDAFASRGVTFSSARSATSWTWPSVASLFTGLYPEVHGVYKHRGYHLDDELVTLAERFQADGYTTAAFVASLVIGTFDNFDQGFETFVHAPMARARAVNERVLAWLDDTEGLARFGYVHYFDPHAPYNAPGTAPADDVARSEGLLRELFDQSVAGEVDPAAVEAWMDIRRPAYDEEVRVFDAAFGELLDALESRGLLDDALIVFTADHGEEFYEHGWVDHGANVYDETVRVPLSIVGFGDSALDARRVDTAVEMRAVAPTLASLLDLPGGADDLPGGADDLWGPSLLDDVTPDVVFGQTDHGLVRGASSYVEKFFVLRDGWKLVRTPSTDTEELYHLPSDPGETVDRLADEPDLAADLAARLDAWRETNREARRTGEGRGLDARSVEMMEALGYLDATSSDDAEARDGER